MVDMSVDFIQQNYWKRNISIFINFNRTEPQTTNCLRYSLYFFNLYETLLGSFCFICGVMCLIEIDPILESIILKWYYFTPHSFCRLHL